MTGTASDRPKVTICIPSIGRMTYLAETLQSIRRQTLADYELLVLYNGIDPNVERRLRDAIAEIPEARVLADPTPMPMFANFNRGLRAARGVYVAFFHDDDVYEPEFLRLTTNFLDAHPVAAFVGSNYLIVDQDNTVVGHRRLIKQTEVQSGHAFISQLVRRGRAAIPTPGIVFRKSAFGPEGWDEKLSMHFGDFVITMRMAEKNGAGLIAEPLMRLRLHGKNASNVPLSVAAPMQHSIIESYIAEFAARWPALVTMAGKLRSDNRSTLIRHLLWGWISADNDEEAAQCLRLMTGNGARWKPGILRALDLAGFRAARRTTLAELVRRLGRSFG